MDPTKGKTSAESSVNPEQVHRDCLQLVQLLAQRIVAAWRTRSSKNSCTGPK